MMIATLLLSIIPQEPASPEGEMSAPSEPTVSAQDEFRTWLGNAAQNSKFPLHVEYEVKANLGFFDPRNSVEATFNGIMTSDVQSQNELRHQLQGLANFGGGREVPLEMTLVLDGVSFWFALRADGLHVVPEDGLYFTGKLSALESNYRFMVDYQKWAVEQQAMSGESPTVMLGPHFSTFMQSLPEDGASLLHPTSTLFYGMAPFRCIELQRQEGSVVASMAVDTRPEAFVVEVLAQWHELWAGMFGDSEREDRTSKALQILGEHLFFTLRFDELTGTPQGLSIDFDINAETLGLGTAEERMTLAANVNMQAHHAKALDASLFGAPTPDRVPTDITGLLDLALIEMQNEKAKDEASLDGEF